MSTKKSILIIAILLVVYVGFSSYFGCTIPFTNIPFKYSDTDLVIYSNKVCYQAFYFGSPTKIKLVKGADPKTFQKINNSPITKDDNQVWWGEAYEIIGADPITITPLYYNTEDENGKIVSVAHPILSKDINHLYIGNQIFEDYYLQEKGKKIDFDIGTFALLNRYYFKDKDHVFNYIGPTLVEGADPKTFVPSAQ